MFPRFLESWSSCRAFQGSSAVLQNKDCLVLSIPLPCSGVLDLLTVCWGRGVVLFVLLFQDRRDNVWREIWPGFCCCSLLTFLNMQFGCWYFHLWRKGADTFCVPPTGSVGLWEGVLYLRECSAPSGSLQFVPCSSAWHHVSCPSHVLCSVCLCLLSFLLPFKDLAQSFP